MGLAAILREEGRQQGRQEGKQEGKQEGHQEGRQEGEATLLLRLMERRFGPLDPDLQARIRTADAETLLQWGERLLTAATPAEVLGE